LCSAPLYGTVHPKGKNATDLLHRLAQATKGKPCRVTELRGTEFTQEKDIEKRGT
jgi:hypothetical protein